jgi:thymidine kinase
MANAEYVSKVHAICLSCGDLAQFSFRKTNNNAIVLLGETNEYAPLCRKCYTEAMSQQNTK